MSQQYDYSKINSELADWQLEPEYSYNFEMFANECYLFNQIAGKDKDCTWVDLRNQFNLIDEEVDEISQGLLNSNITEVVDGVIDTLVVTLGMVQKLQNLGIDMTKAMKLIAENNLEKFPRVAETAEETVEYYKNKGTDIYSTYLPEFKRYVIKDRNQKVRKPVGFESVDLTECFKDFDQQRLEGGK